MVPLWACLLALLVVGSLSFAIGAIRPARRAPAPYYRSVPYEPQITAVTPGRAALPHRDGEGADDGQEPSTGT